MKSQKTKKKQKPLLRFLDICIIIIEIFLVLAVIAISILFVINFSDKKEKEKTLEEKLKLCLEKDFDAECEKLFINPERYKDCKKLGELKDKCLDRTDMSISLAEESIFLKGDINFRLNENYSVGEVINPVIEVFNQENFPIAEANLVIDLVKGCSEPIYPSQLSDCDNIIDEIIISDLNLAPKTNKQITFNYTFPADLQSGTYRIDTYLVAGKAPIVGIPSIHLSSRYKSFYISGMNASGEVKILRTKTNIKNQTGPIGVGVEKNERVNLEVYINSTSEKSAELYVRVCDWEDTTCKNYLIEKTLPINLKTGEQKFDADFNAPASTSAYAIRIEAKKDGKTLSLYRSRIVVFGESAKIRKLYSLKVSYKNEEAKITTLITASPDHYNNPTTKNVSLKITLKNNDGTNYEKTELIDKIEPKELMEKETYFSVEELKDFEICAQLENEITKELYDKYCYQIILSKFSSSTHLVELEKNYEGESFRGRICVKDDLTELPVSTKASILVLYNKSAVLLEEREISGCSELTFKIKENEIYELRVYDQGTNQEFNFEIYNKHKEEKTEMEKIIELGEKFYFLGIILLIIIIIIILILKIWSRK